MYEHQFQDPDPGGLDEQAETFTYVPPNPGVPDARDDTAWATQIVLVLLIAAILAITIGLCALAIGLMRWAVQ